MATNPITISFSKSKVFVWLIAAIILVALGCWLLFCNPVFDNVLLNNPWLVKTIGTASFLFFGIATYFLIRNLMAKGAALIIDDFGIEDFSSAIATKIYWKDIEAIETLTMHSQPVILFKVSNPQAYIEEAKGLKRKMMEMNYKWYGTPVSISATGLLISYEELIQLVYAQFEAYTSTRQ